MTDDLPPEPYTWVGEPAHHHLEETQPMTRESLRRAARTFIITAVGLLIPGVFGFLNAVTEWARAEGQTPFPDARSLAYLGVVAIVAGVVAAVNLLWNAVEDKLGAAVLRTPGQ